MLKKCVSALGAFVLCLALLILPQLMGGGLLFEPGEYYIFYSNGANSGAEMTLVPAEDARAARRNILRLSGESTIYLDESRAFAEAEKYGAVLLFTERAGEVVNYYYYAARLSGAVALCGHAVNLHIAVGGGRSAVGSPLIFGGY